MVKYIRVKNLRYLTETILNKDMFDNKGNPLPHKVLKLFEQIATAHAEELGVGFEALLKRNLLWVVTQIRYELCGEIAADQKVFLETWPLPQNRMGYERCYRITDKSGNVLIKGISNWAIIETVSRKMVATEKIYPNEEYYPLKTFEERSRRLRDFEAQEPIFSVTPDEKYIDNNGHVNNTYYAYFAECALGEFKGKIKSFQIDFIHEVLKDEPLKLYCFENESSVQVKGISKTGERSFACLVNFGD